MANSDKFLAEFRKIEAWLKRDARGPASSSFAENLREVIKRNAAVRRHEDDLRRFADLRNVIVHQHAGEKVIAEPNDWTTERIEEISGVLHRPPKVIPRFQKPVTTMPRTASLAKAAATMYSESYSQIPVYDDGECRGMLTANMISRWLGERSENDLVSLAESKVGDVLKFAERYHDNHKIVSREATLFEIAERFEKVERKERIEVVLITQTGKRDETPIGIITTWDLPEVHQALRLQS